MTVRLDATQERNLRASLAVTGDIEQQVRLVFAVWSESAGYIYANDGTNTSRSPGFDKHPEWPATLRRSLSIPHDKVGSNGRSTGMLQQISTDVGGGWGDMAGTMDPATSARRFLVRLWVTNNPVYSGVLLTPTGSSRVDVVLSPVAADVLRVQQPLADEARSSNYSAAQVQIARDIVAQLGSTPTREDWFTMATPAEVKQAFAEALAESPILRDIQSRIRGGNKDLDALQEIGMGVGDLQHADDAQQASLDAIKVVVSDIHDRILPVGAQWDNIQDIQASLKAIAAALVKP